MELTKQQARRFILLKQGLYGRHIYAGKQGALSYIRSAGCIQFDPVDVCGKMAELTLQSRVKGFAKSQLNELLYEDRALFDFPDKQLSIIPIENWPYFERYRAAAREGGRQFEGLAELETQTLAYIAENGPVCAEELPIGGKINWHSSIHWSGNWAGESNAARSVLEQLYSTGLLVIHHKKGARKYYDLASRHIAAELLSAPDPLPDDYAHQRWRLERRVGAIGLIWDRPSGFWNNIWQLDTATRHRIFAELTEEGRLAKASVEGIKTPLYYLAGDSALLERALSDKKPTSRCELIAPLDPFLWDKDVIKAVFDYYYRWEIYTPEKDRVYGAYVLPLVYGDRFAGRVEAINERKTSTLIVKNVWFEPDIRRTKALDAALERCLDRFRRFNDCESLSFVNKD